MYYCENCHIASEEPRCPACGGRKLREPQDRDFCFLREMPVEEGEWLQERLREKGVDCVVQPLGDVLRSLLALPTKDCRVFVPWGGYAAAQEVLQEQADAETEFLREQLLRGADRLHLSARLERKLRKTDPFRAAESVAAYCRRCIEGAGQITDEGRVTNCPRGGHYFRCLAEGFVFLVNSETMELLSVTPIRRG